MRAKQPTAQVYIPHVTPRDAGAMDHFAGLDAALLARGISVDRIFPGQPLVRLTDRTRIVIVPNAEAAVCRYLIREAARVGAVSIQLMDGIVEWRNTFINPRSPRRFLRPAPVDHIACAGSLDQSILSIMGNNTHATGLPRLARFALDSPPRPVSPVRTADSRSILIATARQPFFNEHEHSRLLASLRSLRDAAAHARVNIHWRLTGSLARDLGVARDDRPLSALLQTSDAVLTTPSTLMIEAMLTGLPTGLIHPHPTPLWQTSPWLYTGPDESVARSPDLINLEHLADLAPSASSALLRLADLAASRSTVYSDPADLFDRLIHPTAEDTQRQTESLQTLHTSNRSLEPLVELIARQLDAPSRSGHAGAFTDDTDLPGIPPLRAGTPRVVFLVKCDDLPIGRSCLIARTLAQSLTASGGYDARVLAITSSIDPWHASATRPPRDEFVDTCVLDPCDDTISTHQRITRALDAMRPTVIIPADRDFCFAAATRARDAAHHHGRSIGVVACTMDASEHDRLLFEHYQTWDAAISITDAAADWLEPLAASRSVPTVRLSINPAAPTEPLPPDQVALLRAIVSHARQVIRTPHPTAVGLSLIEPCHTLAPPPADLAAARAWLDSQWRLAGFDHATWMPVGGWLAGAARLPIPSTHTVIISDTAAPPELDSLLGVTSQEPGATSPRLFVPSCRLVDQLIWFPSLQSGVARLDSARRTAVAHERIRRSLRDLTAAGAKRILLYGIGQHLFRHAAVFDDAFPIVGIIDDRPPAWSHMFGVPVVPTDSGCSLAPDTVVLFSDAHEQRMWDRTESLRARGIRVVPIYASIDQLAARHPPSAAA